MEIDKKKLVIDSFMLRKMKTIGEMQLNTVILDIHQDNRVFVCPTEST